MFSTLLVVSLIGATPEVAVQCDGMTLPVIVTWESLDGKSKGDVEGPKGTMPAGKVRVLVRPARTNGYFTPVRFSVGDARLGEVTLFPQVVDLKDKDVLHVVCETPIAPWNATLVSFKGKPVLVALARPWARFDLEKWEEGKGGKEEFPNAPLFLAKYGAEEMARRVAHRMIAEKEERTDHIGVLPSVGLALTEAEYKSVIVIGLTALLSKCPPEGRSIGEEIAEAKTLLAKGRGVKPR